MVPIDPYSHDLARAVESANSGELLHALEQCRNILLQAPRYAAAHQLAANLYLSSGQAERAWHHVAIALAVRPDHVPTLLIAVGAACAIGDVTAALRCSQQLITMAPGDVRAVFWRAIALRHAGQMTASLEQLESLKAIGSSDPAAWANLAELYQLAERHAEARDAWTKVVQLTPEAYAGWFNLGVMHDTLKDHAAAALAYQSALLRRPDSVEALFNLAIALLETGHPTSAMTHFAHAYALDPACFGRVAHALTASSCGRLWRNPEQLRSALQTAVSH